MEMFWGLFLASLDFCHLLITFANTLDPDQDPVVRSSIKFNHGLSVN